MSLKLEDFDEIYVYRDNVDMRKSIDGLCGVVVNEMKKAVQGKSLFVFSNRRRDRVKLLYFDRTGFALWYKRLERERFQWCGKEEESVMWISREQMEMLLEGQSVFSGKPHKNFEINKVF